MMTTMTCLHDYGDGNDDDDEEEEEEDWRRMVMIMMTTMLRTTTMNMAMAGGNDNDSHDDSDGEEVENGKMMGRIVIMMMISWLRIRHSNRTPTISILAPWRCSLSVSSGDSDGAVEKAGGGCDVACDVACRHGRQREGALETRFLLCNRNTNAGTDSESHHLTPGTQANAKGGAMKNTVSNT